MYTRHVSTRIPPPPTATVKKFAAWAKGFENLKEAGKKIGCTASQVSMLSTGERRAVFGTELAAAIEDEADIPMAHWYRIPERARLSRNAA